MGDLYDNANEWFPRTDRPRMGVFDQPIPPLGLSRRDFRNICALAEINATMYEALERLKVTYELLKNNGS